MNKTSYEFVISRDTPFKYVTNTTDPNPMYRKYPTEGIRTEKAMFRLSFPTDEIDWDDVIERGTELYPHLLPKDMPMVEIDGSKHLRSVEPVSQRLANGSWGRAYVYLYEIQGRV